MRGAHNAQQQKVGEYCGWIWFPLLFQVSLIFLVNIYIQLPQLIQVNKRYTHGFYFWRSSLCWRISAIWENNLNSLTSTSKSWRLPNRQVSPAQSHGCWDCKGVQPSHGIQKDGSGSYNIVKKNNIELIEHVLNVTSLLRRFGNWFSFSPWLGYGSLVFGYVFQHNSLTQLFRTMKQKFRTFLFLLNMHSPIADG